MQGTIESMAFGGEGILRHEGLVVFVPYTAPQDQVEIAITEQKKNFAKGKLLSLLKPSPFRAQPQCCYFGQCGGCQFQHIAYNEQLNAKKIFIQDALHRIAGIKFDAITIFPADLQWQYRRHVRLKVTNQNGKFATAYTAIDNFTLIPIIECPIFLPENHPLFPLIYSLFQEIDFNNTDEATIRIIKTGKQLDRFVLAFSFSDSLPQVSEKFNDLLSSNSLIKGVLMNALFGKKKWGEIDCDATVLGLNVKFSPLGFMQNHPQESEKLYQAVLNYLPKESRKILDLYCGIGITSLLFASLDKKIFGVESHHETIELAKENARINQLNVQFYQGKAEDLGIELLKKEHPDTIFCNPPRTGLDAKLLDSIIFYKPRYILYVSCMPSTLARDLKRLVQSGYRINAVQGFDLFPQTTHVETFVSLEYSDSSF